MLWSVASCRDETSSHALGLLGAYLGSVETLLCERAVGTQDRIKATATTNTTTANETRDSITTIAQTKTTMVVVIVIVAPCCAWLLLVSMSWMSLLSCAAAGVALQWR